MQLTLEYLTKPELIKLIKKCYFKLPSQRDILGLRWESMTEEANRIMAEASQESQKWAGIKSWEAIKKWHDAQEKFNRGLALSDKAEVVFKKLMG